MGMGWERTKQKVIEIGTGIDRNRWEKIIWNRIKWYSIREDKWDEPYQEHKQDGIGWKRKDGIEVDRIR